MSRSDPFERLLPESDDGQAHYLPVPAPPDAAPPRVLAELLDGVSEAVVVCDRDGVVRGLYGTAGRLLPSITVGGDIAQSLLAHLDGGPDLYSGTVDGSELTCRSRPLSGGRTAWYANLSETGAPSGPLDPRFLGEASRRLSSSLHHDQVIDQVVQIPVPRLAAVCLYLARDADGGVRWFRWSDGADGTVSGRLGPRGAARLEWLAELVDGRQRQAEPLPGDLARLLPQDGRRWGGTLALPVPGCDGHGSVLLLLREQHQPAFGDDEIALLREYCDRVSTAVNAALLYRYQARTAETLRAGLVPPPLPEVEGTALGAAYRCALEAELIGGDYYEVSATDEGVEFLLGDVCGKGTQAAALAGLVRQSLTALRLVERRPLTLLELLNTLVVDSESERFTTLALGRAVRDGAGGLEVTLAGGGHLPVLVLRADGTVEEITTPGMLVGIMPDAAFGTASFTLAPGEVMLLYSDGITEARDASPERRMFGDARLRALLAECAGMPAAAVAERVDQVVGDWLHGGEHDDIAVLAVQPGGVR